MRLICNGLKHYLSPEMLTRRMRLEGIDQSVSISTICRWLRWGWGQWYQYLQRANRPVRRRYGNRSWRSGFDNHRSIHDCADMADLRARCGDWEGDTVYDKGGLFITLVDRCSKYFMARKIPIQTKKITIDSAVKMLRGHSAHTLIVDNGIEFADHKRIERQAETIYSTFYGPIQTQCAEATAYY